MEVYDLVASTSSFGAEAILLGFMLLLVGLFYESEAFERLVGSRIKGPLSLAYGTFGLPLMFLLLSAQRSRGGGILRFLGGLVSLVIVVILLIIGVLALIAYLIYRALRRRR